jgi:hypothetical protein
MENMCVCAHVQAKLFFLTVTNVRPLAKKFISCSQVLVFLFGIIQLASK